MAAPLTTKLTDDDAPAPLIQGGQGRDAHSVRQSAYVWLVVTLGAAAVIIAEVLT